MSVCSPTTKIELSNFSAGVYKLRIHLANIKDATAQKVFQILISHSKKKTSITDLIHMICFLLRRWELKNDKAAKIQVTRSHKASPAGDGSCKVKVASPVLSDILLGLLRGGRRRSQALGCLFGLP